MTLGDYLLSARCQRHEWGLHDCCTFPAGWVLTWGLGDPMERWRGRYDSEEAAYAYIADAGGLDELWAVGLADIGAEVTAEPEEGDVGVVRVVGTSGPCQVGGIFTGRRWAVLAPRGLAFITTEPVVAWTRPNW